MKTNMELELESQMKREWEMAQKIDISVDLIAAARNQLLFLEKIEQIGNLYEGEMVERAITRYRKNFLPLLANIQGPLIFVVPLDVEWIWHCHRLNPICYKEDCDKFYGKVLDCSKNVVSSVSVESIKYKKQSEEIWKRMYPTEPYEVLSMINSTTDQQYLNDPAAVVDEFKYDLLSAVKRQKSFFYQVSRPHVKDDRFLQAALARYKGFLHLNKRNMEKVSNTIKRRRFWVPTYDIDLMWHSHQLLPVAYNKDMQQLFGCLLGHDDSETDRTKGKKLDVGFSETTQNWEDMFGSRYWRAGAMYRGRVPSTAPPTTKPCNEKDMVQLMEVMMEIVAVKDLPGDGKDVDGILYVTCCKKQEDAFFNIRDKQIGIFSETKKKDVCVFQCQPAGELFFELIVMPSSGSAKSLGTTSISLQNDLLSKNSQLYVEKWFELMLAPDSAGLKPVNLRIALSFTTPVSVPVPSPVLSVGDNKTKNGGGHAHCGSCAGCGGTCDVSFKLQNNGGGVGGGYAHCGSCAGCGGTCDVSFKPENAGAAAGGGGAHCGSSASGCGVACGAIFKT